VGNQKRRSTLIQESFEEASQKLVEFLRSQGHPDHVVWIFREEITGFRRQVFVHPSPPETNRELARRLFNFGIEQGRGLKLMVLGFAEHRAYSYLEVPADDIDASQSMTSGLHFNVGLENHETGRGRVINRVPSPLLFALRRLYCRLRGETFFVKELPLHRNLQSAAHPESRKATN
jgi:hypothetical protein